MSYDRISSASYAMSAMLLRAHSLPAVRYAATRCPLCLYALSGTECGYAATSFSSVSEARFVGRKGKGGGGGGGGGGEGGELSLQ
eukprot:1865955-Rhodomonas_salina.1